MALSDEDIHKMAKERVGFKQHLATYLIINAMFVVIWFLTSGRHHASWASFWPIWPMLGWGVGLAFHGVNAYRVPGGVAREEEKLRQRYR